MALEEQNTLADTFNQLVETEKNISNSVEDSQVEIDNYSTLATDLDYEEADHPLSDLSQFNKDALTGQYLESNGSVQVADTPAGTTQETTVRPYKNLTDEELKNLSKQNHAKAKDLAKSTPQQLTKSYYNPYMAFKDYEFDQYTTNVDRYRGYGKSKFNQLGFDPMDDMEKYYNANTTSWDDFKRMSGEFMNIAGYSLKGNYKSFENWLIGDSSITDPDSEYSKLSERANRIGMSSKKGALAFTSNVSLAFAYTAGMLANIAAEELVIGAISAGMAATGAGAPGALALQVGEKARTANKLRRIAESWKAGMTGYKSVGYMWKGGVQLLKSLRHVDDARQFWQAARAGGKMFGKGVLHFANPFEATAETIKGIKAGTMGYKNLSNYAKASRTFGSFYRDVRNGWFAIGESQLEGGGSYNDIVNDQIKIYMDANGGKFPPQEELDNIYKNAYDGGKLNTMINLPMIYLSNKLTLDGIFKFRGAGKILNAAEEYGVKGSAKGLAWNFSEKAFSKGNLGYLKNIGKAALDPRVYVAAAANYTKRNFIEAVQELGQETSSGAIKNYYHNTYLNPTLGGNDYVKSMILTSIDENVFSKRGAETFATGFLIGGMSNVVTKTLSGTLKGATELYLKVAKPDKYNTYIANRDKAQAVVANAMSTIVKDADKFFSRKKESVVNQKAALQNMSEAEINNDDYAFQSAKDDLTFDHIFTALDGGGFGMVVGALRSYEKLTDTELAEAFNLKDGAQAREKLKEYIGRAEQIKENYDFAQDKFPNPFNPKAFEKGSEDQIREFIAYKSFEDAKKAFILSNYGFQRATERMVKVFEDFQKNPVLKKASATEITALQSTENIDDEIRILESEISLLEGGDKEQKKIGKLKKRKLEDLKEFKTRLDAYLEQREDSTITDDGKLVKPTNDTLIFPLKIAFKKYIKTLAEVHGEKNVLDENIDKAFNQLFDYYQLSDDAKSYTNIVNRLLNPDELVRYAETINNSLNDIYTNRDFYVAQSVNNYLNIYELNALMNALGKMGVVINPEEVIDMYKSGKMPTTFFDLYKNTIIEKSDPRYDDIIANVETYTRLRKEKGGVAPEETGEAKATTEEQKAEEAKPETAATPEEVKEAAEEVTTGEKIPDDLLVELKDGYNEFINDPANANSMMTFEQYIAPLSEGGSPKAANIREEYERKKAEAGKPAPAAPAAKTKTIQTNPESVGANTPIVVVDNPNERPEIFDEWIDSQILGAGVQPILVAERTKELHDIGQRLDNNGAPWSIGSFRANVGGRLIVDVFAGGEHFLVYKSTGEGTGIESKGEWVPITGFAMNGWFIKDYWKGQNPKFNKYESKTFQAIHDYLAQNEASLFEEKPAAPETAATFTPTTAYGTPKGPEVTTATTGVGVKPGVAELFKSNPELAKLGTPEQYSQYLDTIFPNSQVKDIVYHSSPNKIETFRDSMFGTYFSYSPIKGVYGNIIHSVLLNINNPLVKPKPTDTAEQKTTYDKEYRAYNNPSSPYDASIEGSTVTDEGIQVRVKNPEQIYILGSKQDIEGFKKFTEQKETKPAETPTAPTSEIKTVDDIKRYFFNKQPGLFGGDLNAALTMSNWTMVSNSLAKGATQEELNMLEVLNGRADISTITGVKPTAPVSDIEAQRADVEIVSSAEKLKNLNQVFQSPAGKFGILSAKDNKTIIFSNTLEQAIEKADIERRRQEELQQAEEKWRASTNERGIPTYSIQPIQKEINDKYDAELAALETGKPAEAVQEEQTVEVQDGSKDVVIEPSSGVDKVNKILSGVNKLTELPNQSFSGKSEVTLDLLDLIMSGEVSSDEVKALIETKRDQLNRNLTVSDFVKNSFVTFKDGRKGYVKFTKGNNITMKMIGSPEGVTETLTLDNLKGNIFMIEEKREVPVQPTPDIEISTEDKAEVEASKDTMNEFVDDAALINDISKSIEASNSTDNSENLKDLFENIGCQTKGK